MTLTVGLKELQERSGVAQLDSGDLVSIDAAVREMCDANVSLAVLGNDGEILRYGHSRRTVSPGLRRALIARDKGCVVGGCGAPPEHCDAHHLTPWIEGGRSDIDNLGLHCGYHHALVHHSDWHAVMLDGIPHVIPPPWVGPSQTPRRNRLHDRHRKVPDPDTAPEPGATTRIRCGASDQSRPSHCSRRQYRHKR